MEIQDGHYQLFPKMADLARNDSIFGLLHCQHINILLTFTGSTGIDLMLEKKSWHYHGQFKMPAIN
jgi:hypothetical protein